ncbi:MAG: S-layer homology domain-containing protein, partial [Oscillospiraceae bacterium]|nr:S-layer homology domain-containing protein [Oscillospiraceae bacterium]
EHAVAFLYRAAGEPSYTMTSNPFVDVKSGAYYYDAVLWAVEKNITKGMDETHFGPENSCERSQIVTFLYRFMNP